MESFLLILYTILSFLFYLLPVIVIIAGISQLKKRKNMGIFLIVLGAAYALIAIGLRVYYSFFA